jgi:hypothetical protein
MEGDKIHNVAFLLRRDGSIERQAKLHVTPNERKWWGIEPGDALHVFDTDCGKICILVCYDVEFPELARIAAARGAGILFVPFNTNDRLGYLRVRPCRLKRPRTIRMPRSPMPLMFSSGTLSVSVIVALAVCGRACVPISSSPRSTIHSVVSSRSRSFEKLSLPST